MSRGFWKLSLGGWRSQVPQPSIRAQAYPWRRSATPCGRPWAISRSHEIYSATEPIVKTLRCQSRGSERFATPNVDLTAAFAASSLSSFSRVGHSFATEQAVFLPPYCGAVFELGHVSEALKSASRLQSIRQKRAEAAAQCPGWRLGSS